MKRVVPFVNCLEGARLFSYAEGIGKGLLEGVEVKSYDRARRVRKEGASVVVKIPSRRKKHPRYTIKLSHVPVIRSQDNLASVLSLRPFSQGLDELLLEDESLDRTLHDIYNMRYTYETQREGSDIIFFYPQDIAAYIAVAGKMWKEHNLTPMEMNPFAIPSRKEADFYRRLCNNVLVFDETISRKDKLRKLHLAEKSILLARSIKVFGHYDSMYWEPQRDGKLKDYDWSIP